MNLNHLRYFLVAAEVGSFTRASERLFITQPSLSVSIQKLEKDLGVKLFERQQNRQKHPVRLTSSGKHFLEKARDILSRFESAKAELHHTGFGPQILKIGVLHTLPMVDIAGLIGNFSKAFPSTVIEQISGNVVELEDWLEKGDIDLTISVFLREQEGRETSQALFQRNYLAAVSEAHPLAKRASLSFSELNGLLYIDRTRCELRDYLQRAFAERGICPKTTYKTEHDDLSNALVTTGVGLAVIPARKRIPGMASLPFSDLKLTRPVGLEWRSEESLKTVSLFREISTSYFVKNFETFPPLVSLS